jgi:DNA phosphorothioation-associated putative methyltransferase
MDDCNQLFKPATSVEIHRHRAAIRRTEPSLPLKCLLRDGFLCQDAVFFDYGCGYGDDIEQVRRLGLAAHGWDPAYRPDDPIFEAEVVNLGYVINVIEDQTERVETLRAAWNFAKRVLVVSARIAVDGTSDGNFEFGDGVVTKIQTFQKYYTQTELREYLEQTLGIEPVSAAPGVFYLFQDPTLRETFLASKYRRRSFAPRRRSFELEFDRHRDLLEELIRVSADLARLPFHDEFPRTEEIVAQLGSVKRAFKLIRKVTGADPWESLRQIRVDDLRVYLALARFPKRQPFSQMTLSMQRDIKEFFGGYRNACDSADRLLFEAGSCELIDAACQRSQVGRLTSNALYVHQTAVQSLEPVLRVFEGCARAYLGEIEDANVVKLHRFSGKVSYLACPKFDTHPHPPVKRTIKLSLRNLYLQCIDHSENRNPLLLDRKEEMVESDHPWRERFYRFSQQEFQHGLLDKTQDMLAVLEWNRRLQDAGLMIRGNRLLYQEGVKRKRLPTRRASSPAIINEPPDEAIQSSCLEADSRAALPQAATEQDQEGQVDTILNKPSELPIRCRRYGVGKEIGDAVYVHKNYEERLGETVDWARRHLPNEFDYTVVKLNQRTDSVSFIHCPGFDNEDEPTIAAIVVVNADGRVQRRALPSDPFIYHHKWLFVDDEYSGFDVAASKKRSLDWIFLSEIDRSRIGKKSFWEQEVLPRLTMMLDKNPMVTEDSKQEAATTHIKERWVRSEEARKTLRISTCQLAHLRNSAMIKFKKEGRFYLYLIEKPQ